MLSLKSRGSLLRVLGCMAAVAVVASVAPSAFADDPYTPASFGTITMPISISSTVTGIVTAGGLVLVAYIGPKIAFKFFHKLASRLGRAAG